MNIGGGGNCIKSVLSEDEIAKIHVYEKSEWDSDSTELKSSLI